MKYFDRIDEYTHKSPSVWMNILRVSLGLFLIWKGIQFGENQRDLQIIIAGSPFDFLSLLIVQYTLIVHFAAGTMILFGIQTRVAVFFQLPLVVGALLFSHYGSLIAYSDIVLTAITGLALITFLFYGSGGFSADRYLKLHPNG
jgi:putative oxidoreductase